MLGQREGCLPSSKTMLRSLIKTGAAWGLHWTGTSRLMRAWSKNRNVPVIVGYHRVVDDFGSVAQTSIPAMLTTCQMLERHLEWMQKRFHFVSLDELGGLLESRKTPRAPVAAVTFDDGYSDVYYNAFPILKDRKIPAAVFVVTDLIGSSLPQFHDRLHL